MSYSIMDPKDNKAKKAENDLYRDTKRQYETILLDISELLSSFEWRTNMAILQQNGLHKFKEPQQRVIRAEVDRFETMELDDKIFDPNKTKRYDRKTLEKEFEELGLNLIQDFRSRLHKIWLKMEDTKKRKGIRETRVTEYLSSNFRKNQEQISKMIHQAMAAAIVLSEGKVRPSVQEIRHLIGEVKPVSVSKEKEDKIELERKREKEDSEQEGFEILITPPNDNKRPTKRK